MIIVPEIHETKSVCGGDGDSFPMPRLFFKNPTKGYSLLTSQVELIITTIYQMFVKLN